MKRALLAMAAMAAIAAFVTGCRTFSVPSDVCKPDSVNGKQIDGRPDLVCSACLEDQCCDEVGRCQDDAACASQVSKTQACVVSQGLGGGAVERRCADENLKGERSSTLVYQCMRQKCGEPCGLPVCQVDPAAALVVSPACDNCFTGSCCDAINACYGNRTCKLIVECLTTTCRASLSGTLVGLDAQVAQGVADEACKGNASTLGSSCVQSCIDQFSQFEQGLLLDPAKTARCLATRVVACGARAGCGAKCGP